MSKDARRSQRLVQVHSIALFAIFIITYNMLSYSYCFSEVIVDRTGDLIYGIKFGDISINLGDPEDRVDEVIPNEFLKSRKIKKHPYLPNETVLEKCYNIERDIFCFLFEEIIEGRPYTVQKIRQVRVANAKKRATVKPDSPKKKQGNSLDLGDYKLVVGKVYLGDELLRVIDMHFPDATFHPDQSIRFKHKGNSYILRTSKVNSSGPAYYRIDSIQAR